MVCVVYWNCVIDVGCDMRCREDVVSDFRGAFGQIAFGFFTLLLLTNTLSKVIFRIKFGIEMADRFGGWIYFWSAKTCDVPLDGSHLSPKPLILPWPVPWDL